MKVNKHALFRYYPGIRTKLYIFVRSILLLLEEVEHYIPLKGMIYDMGCGYGLTTVYFALKSKDRTVVGIDVDRQRIDTVAKIFGDIENLSFDARDLAEDVEIGACDCIVMYDLLHHIDHDSQVKLLHRCTEKLKRRNGLMVIKEIDSARKIKLFFTYIFDKMITKNARVYYTSAHYMISLLEEMGCRVQHKKLRSVWYPHYLLVCSM